MTGEGVPNGVRDRIRTALAEELVRQREALGEGTPYVWLPEDGDTSGARVDGYLDLGLLVERVVDAAGVSAEALKLTLLEEAHQRLREAAIREAREIDQTLGRALGFPRYADDPVNFPGATDADGVCTGEHVPATLAQGAADEIARLRTGLDRVRREALLNWGSPGVSERVVLHARDALGG